MIARLLAPGAFTKPDVTMEQMIDRVFGIMTEYQVVSPDDVRRKLPTLFRSLVRWRA